MGRIYYFTYSTDVEGCVRNLTVEHELPILRFKTEGHALLGVRSHGRLLNLGAGLAFYESSASGF